MLIGSAEVVLEKLAHEQKQERRNEARIKQKLDHALANDLRREADALRLQDEEALCATMNLSAAQTDIIPGQKLVQILN